MWIDGETCFASLWGDDGRHRGQEIDGHALGIADRVLHRRLESFPQVQDDVGGRDRLHLIG